MGEQDLANLSSSESENRESLMWLESQGEGGLAGNERSLLFQSELFLHQAPGRQQLVAVTLEIVFCKMNS